MTKGRVSWALALLVTGAVTGGARPAAADTLTLDDVEARAQRERPELRERRASIDKANADLAAVRAKTGPTLGARGDLSLAPGGQLVTVFDPNNGDEYFVQGARTLGQSGALVPRPRYAAVLSGKLTLLDFGRTKLGVRAAEAAISAERASLIQAKVELVRVARQAYLGWIEAHQTWQLAQKDAEVTSARTANVRELIQEGARPATDATLSAYDEQLAQLREARARRASSLAFELLAASVQSELPPGSVPDLGVIEPVPSALAPANPALAPAASGAAPAIDAAPAMTAAAAPTTAAAAPATPAVAPAGPALAPASMTAADAARSGLEALDRQRDAALSAAQAADRSSTPVLEAGAEVGVQGQDSRLFPEYRAGLSLSVPIFDGGAQAALADQHRAEALGLEARRQRLQNQIEAQRRASELTLRSAADELTLSLGLLATAETLLSQAEDHYRSGSDTLERVLSAQRSLVQARREVLTSKLDNAKARLELVPIQLRD